MDARLNGEAQLPICTKAYNVASDTSLEEAAVALRAFWDQGALDDDAVSIRMWT